MKKLAISFALVMISVLAACSAKERETMKETKGNKTTVPVATSTPTPTPTTAVAIPDDLKNAKLVALTFDDGPTAETTPLVLDKLEKHGVVASFFLIGRQINDKTKQYVEREIKMGCEIENHSWNHTDMTKLTDAQIKKEIDDTTKKIQDTFGVTPTFFRPPYLAVNNTMYKAIDLPFICGFLSRDWEPDFTADQRADLVINGVKDGNLVLLHDLAGNTNTVEALDKIIPALKDKGFKFVTLSQLFKYKGINPIVENKMWSNVLDK